MKKTADVLLLACLLILCFSAPANAENPFEKTDGKFFTLVDEAGEDVTHTALILGIGDSYINEDNKLYEVSEIDGDTVKTVYKETVELPNVDDLLASMAVWDGIFGPMDTAVEAAPARNKGTIALYCTHSGESYVPDSGTASKETGDIYKVGETLKEALEGEGFNVVFSKANHNPHDAEAYSRSRRTATELKKEDPTTIIDVHRDAIPGSYYETEVNGTKMSKVRLVVGRQNQNRETTLEYAKRIKAIADKKYPGYIKGIFNARGNYNQDLDPKMMLIEVGTYENELEWAQESAKVFAKILPAAAGMTSRKAAQQVRATENETSSRAIYWVIGIALALVLGYVALNRSGTKS